jgi:undecaprenyl-diphosphatase
MGQRADRRAALLTFALGFVACCVFAALAAQVYDAATESDGIAGLDQPALRTALDLRTPALTVAVARFTDLGGTLGMTLLATAAALLLAVRSRSVEPLVLTALTAAGSVSMTVIGKAVVGRGRPPFVDAVPPFQSSFSFPSGHSLNSMALAGVLAYLAARRCQRRWARVAVLAAAFAFAVAMGLSRVYLGHHWLTDVVGAWALALAWLAVVLTAHQLYLWAGRSRPSPRPLPAADAAGGDTV